MTEPQHPDPVIVARNILTARLNRPRLGRSIRLEMDADMRAMRQALESLDGAPVVRRTDPHQSVEWSDLVAATAQLGQAAGAWDTAMKAYAAMKQEAGNV